MIAARVLRGLFWAGLGTAALLLARGDGSRAAGTFTVGPGDEDGLIAALASARPPGRIAWADAAGPGARAAWLLAPGPAIPPLWTAVGVAPRIRAQAPVRPIAGRAAALSIVVDGAAGDTVEVRWRDLLGHVDRRSLTLGPDGRAEAGLRVRPARAGWQAWTVGAGDDSIAVGAWVLPERPVRILALAGSPDWEARFALRALDEAGIAVDARFDLGRVRIGTPDWDASAYDAVLLLGDAAPSDAAVRDLVDFARRGGGVLVAPGQPPGAPASQGDGPAEPPGVPAPRGDRPAEPGARPPIDALLDGLGLARSIAPGPPLETGAEPIWALPAELSPLPPAPARAATVTFHDPDRSARVAARSAADGAPIVVARAFGRGRAAVLGLPESWRWRMQGGAVDVHRAWWRAWAEWAASGVRAPVVATVSEGRVPIGGVVRVRLEALDSGAAIPTVVRLERPGGAVAELRVARSGAAGEARFLAAGAGEHRLTWPGGETGVLAAASRPPPDPSERAWLALAGSRGGRVLPPDGRAAETPADRADGDAGGPWRGPRPSGLPLLLGALLGAVALAEWTLRRLRGRP